MGYCQNPSSPAGGVRSKNAVKIRQAVEKKSKKVIRLRQVRIRRIKLWRTRKAKGKKDFTKVRRIGSIEKIKGNSRKILVLLWHCKGLFILRSNYYGGWGCVAKRLIVGIPY
jgi:hypothetical protein